MCTYLENGKDDCFPYCENGCESCRYWHDESKEAKE